MQSLAAQAAKFAGAGGDPQATASAAKCAATAQKFVAPLQKATLGLATRAQAASRVLAIILLLFVLHQLFFWIDEKPEIAFDQAALAFDVVEVTWDTSSIVYNAAVDIVNSGVVPLWNAGVYYTIEPTLTLLVELNVSENALTELCPEIGFLVALQVCRRLSSNLLLTTTCVV